MTTEPATTVARGGKALYGAPLGILMLEARFPLIPGDMGNAAARLNLEKRVSRASGEALTAMGHDV